MARLGISLCGTACSFALLIVAASHPARADDAAARALAEKFAEAASAPERKAPDRKAEESDMLARARAEAEERRLAEQQATESLQKAEAEKRLAEETAAELKKAEDEKHAAEVKRIAEEKAAAELKKAEDEKHAAEEKRLAEEKAAAELKKAEDEKHAAEEKRLAEEKAAAELKKAEDEKRIAEEKRLAEEKAAAELKKAEDDKRIAEEKRLAEEKAAAELKTAEDERLAGLKSTREAEARELENRIQKAAAARESKLAEKAPIDPPAGLGARDVAPPTASSNRVTVLLAMNPGTTGIRRFGAKTADPVICAGTSCWVSAGPALSAASTSRGSALGPANTLGKRAAACNHTLVCVFRNVDLAAGALLQPIDLRILHHDRRETALAGRAVCDLHNGELSCTKGIESTTWRAMIIPEDLAARAGPAALEAALSKGLAPAREAALKPY